MIRILNEEVFTGETMGECLEKASKAFDKFPIRIVNVETIKDKHYGHLNEDRYQIRVWWVPA